jgi:hypothetical protein
MRSCGAGIGLIVLLGAGPVLADLTRDDAFATILAGDQEAVLQMLSAIDPAEQRVVFSAFQTAHPQVATLSADLLAAHPGDPRAMVARGWHLQASGWAWRGGGYASTVHPEGMANMMARHAEAMALAEAARDMAPEMVAASDLVMSLAMTLGEDQAIAEELDRIMPLVATRHSLLLAASGLAPRWGGPQGWADGACAEWAAQVTDVEGYTVEVCALDMLFSAWGSWDDKVAVWPRLLEVDHPLLDGARLGYAQSGLADTDWSIAEMEAAFERGALDLFSADTLDRLKGETAGLTEMGPTAQEILPAELLRTRAEADFDPASTVKLEIYVHALSADARLNGTAWPAEELDRRYALLFQLSPLDFYAWQGYAGRLQGGLDMITVSLDEIERVRGYFINGVVAGQHSPEALSGLELFNRMVWQDLERRNLDAMDATGAPEFAKEEFDRVVVCPAVRAIRVLQAVCEGSSGGRGCPYPDEPVTPGSDPLARAEKRKACTAELTGDPRDLGYDWVETATPAPG